MSRLRLHRLAAAVTLSCVVWAAPSLAHAADSETYVVKSGDHLIGIAMKSNVDLTTLLAANDLTVTSLIVPGQRLVVPGATALTAPASVMYTVRSGDSLIRIASRSKVSLSSLLTANDMTVNSLIMPGMRLRLPQGAVVPSIAATPGSQVSGPDAAGPAAAASAPLTYTVESGDYLSGIASRHRVSLSSLVAANSMTSSSVIMPGMVLRLPAAAVVPTPEPVAPTAAPAATDTSTAADAVVRYALDQVGRGYAFFTAGPDTFDCSGLTKAAYATIGIDLFHYSAWQARQGTAVDFLVESIQPGDLVFLASRGSDVINHVGIAIDSTRWVHAASTNDGVRIGGLPSTSTIVAVRRFVAAD